MDRWQEWDRDATYQPGDIVRYGQRLWCATRVVTGSPPGAGTAWAVSVEIVDKADAAMSRDPRIGRGL